MPCAPAGSRPRWTTARRARASIATTTSPGACPWAASPCPRTLPAPSPSLPTPKKAASLTASLCRWMAAGPPTEAGRACAWPTASWGSGRRDQHGQKGQCEHEEPDLRRKAERRGQARLQSFPVQPVQNSAEAVLRARERLVHSVARGAGKPPACRDGVEGTEQPEDGAGVQQQFPPKSGGQEAQQRANSSQQCRDRNQQRQLDCVIERGLALGRPSGPLLPQRARLLQQSPQAGRRVSGAITCARARGLGDLARQPGYAPALGGAEGR